MVGAIRLYEFEKSSFVVSLPVALDSVTNAERISQRQCKPDPVHLDVCRLHDITDMCQGIINGLALQSDYGSIDKVLSAQPWNKRADIRKHLLFWKAADRLWYAAAVCCVCMTFRTSNYGLHGSNALFSNTYVTAVDMN